MGKASTKVRFFEQNGKVKCYLEGAYCFTQGTPILLANDQLKPIEQIAVGDTVATYNHELKRLSFGVVKRLFKRSTKKLTRLAIAGSLLFATPSHKIYADGEYQPASSVTTDSELLAANGKKLQIQSVETIDSTASVYNFEVKGDHNYFAGANGVLVHNSCGWKTLRKRVVEAGKEARFRTFHQSIISSGLTPVQRKKLYDKIEALGDKSSDFIDDFAENVDALKKFADDDKLVDSWKFLDETSAFKALRTDDNWLTRVNEWDEVGIGFAEFNGKFSLARKETGEVFADFVRNGSDEFFEIDVDNFLPYAAPTSGSIQWSESVTMTVRSASGENITGAIAKTTDGTFGFVEDVSSYGSAVVQNTITQRSLLRRQLAGIRATEEAHHLIPVELLKDNQVVKKAVEEGFDFNGIANGIPLEKYVNGSGRHAAHGNYTDQIRQALLNFEKNNPSYSAADAKQFLEILVDGNPSYKGLRKMLEETTGRINLLNLNIPF